MTTEPGPVSLGIVGAGWRSEYFLRIAAALPDRFEIRRMLVRSEGSAQRAQSRWGIPATIDIEDFIRSGPYDYVIVSVPVEETPDVAERLIAADIPVLLETPPAADLPTLSRLWQRSAGALVQVAEQYGYQPAHAARLSVARSGIIGTPTATRISVAHGYHAISLARLALGVGFEPVSITAESTVERVASARGRDSWNEQISEVDSERITALLRFGDRSGYLDFSIEQYFSPIRSRHITVSGTRGEIVDDDVSYLVGPGHAAHERLTREVTGIDGDLEGGFLRRILLGREIHYENRFSPERFNDDESAVAEVMHRMARFVRTGEEFYGLADASHDQYLSLLVGEAVAGGGTVTTAAVPWDSRPSVAVPR
jgi:predicted dehydrogenase